MESFEQTSGLRHEYRYKAWLMVLMCLVAICIGGSCIFVWSATYEKTRSFVPGSLFAILPIFIAAYFLLMGLRSRIILEGSRIDVRGAFTDKSADQSEIQGFRTISSRNGAYTQLILKEGRGTITISNSFSTDDAYRAWFQKVPDLDERDRKALLDEIAQQQDLGATPEERLGALGMAKTWSIALIVVSILLGGVIMFSNDATSLSTVRLCVVLLALVPLVSAWLVRSSPLLYTILKKKKDPRGDVGWPIFIAGLAFIFRTTGIHFVSMGPMIFSMVVVAIALAALFYNAASSSARSAWVALLMFAGLYGYGLIAATDIVFDNSPAAAYAATIVSGHVSHGKSTTYYLRLAPWGPIDHEKDVSVSYTVYHHAHLGDSVCTTLHNGSLHAPWFRVTTCEDQSAPQNTAPSDLPQ
jgi:hypothetical protein